jgi:ABC-2 type transport system ATP-binding protein
LDTIAAVGHMLVIVEGRDAGREISVTESIVIGRDVGADVVIGDIEVSTNHASFTPADGGLTVQDLGSTNGTFVNGERVSGPQELRAGDRVQVGGTILELRGPEPIAPSAKSIAPQLQVTRARQIPKVPLLLFLTGQQEGSSIPVGEPVVIGRDPGAADVILDQDTEISRRHAVFSPAGAGITLQDLGSTNGTFVNGQRITGTVALRGADKVQLGSTEIEVKLMGEAPLEPAPTPATRSPTAQLGTVTPNSIEVEGLVKQFGDYRAVDGISLHVDPGEVYGFLGPNGAGKSTTVHMLTTLIPPTAGVARIAGFDVDNQGAQVRTTIGVALQAAALDAQLNAWEHMALQTALQGIPKNERKARARELLDRVKLTDVAGRRVGGYSGGMKRRLDLALALVHRPRVLFLDEPTTGLDPQSRTDLWEEVARLVKDEGMTVFLTTQYLEEADVLADRVGIIDHGEIVAEDTPTALKEQIGRPTLEVVPLDDNDWSAISEVLARFGELASSAHRGIAVRLRTGVDNLAEVIRALDAEGLRVANVELHAPTLDDVFLAKTGRPIEGAAEEEAPEQPDILQQLSVAGVPGVPTDSGA